MRSKILFVTLIFDVCLVLFVHVAEGKICDGNDFTITDSNGTFIRCLRCGTCHPGFGLEPKCGMTLHHPPKVSCHPCKAGTFSSEYDSSSCKVCHQCAKGESIKEFCSTTSDTICSGKCEKGFYLRKKAPHNCQKCSTCCLDGKDEKIQECIDQGLNEQCSPRPDKSCSPTHPGGTDASKSGGLSPTSISIIAVFGAVVLIVAVIATVYTCYRGRKRPRTEDVEEQPSRQSCEMSSVGQGPSIIISDTREGFHSAGNPFYQGTPIASRPVNPVSTSTPGPHDTTEGFNSAGDPGFQGTPRASRADFPTSNPEPHASVSQVPSIYLSVTGEGFAAGNPGFQGTPRASRADFPTSNPEPHESLIIEKHPKSQKQREGSTVEFKCEVQGRKEVSYQWLKDGTKIQGQNSAILVLDPVKLCDFGCYTCEVRSIDSQWVESHPAMLDVTPGDGMRLKCLTEVFKNSLDDQEKVQKLLVKDITGAGGWKKVAFKYKMDEEDISSLEGSQDAGARVIDFLKARNPELTVYDFCKTLHKISRLDIVKVLSRFPWSEPHSY